MKKNRHVDKDKSNEKNKKAYGLLISIVCLLFIGTLSIINVVKADNKISEQENRSLQQKPKFQLSTLINGEFTKEYGDYIADQFPCRNFFVNLKTKLELSTGKNESNDVFIAKNNYLIEDFQKSSSEELKAKMDSINAFVNENKSIKTSLC